MKTLILSCNNGGGHNSVASAIKDVYVSHGETADIIDSMGFLPYDWSRIASDFHSFIYRYEPEFFDYQYQQAEKHRRRFNKGSATRTILDIGSHKLRRYIRYYKYDRVICTHVFAGMMLADTIQRYNLNIVSGLVETDYTVTPGSEKSVLDWHFVPSSQQRDELVGYGIPEDKIVVSGIPTRAQFSSVRSMANAKANLGLPVDKKNIVVCCGSMGCGPMDELVAKLSRLQEDDDSFSLTLLCAKNKGLYDRMSEKYKACNDIHVFREMKNMSLVLDSADVFMTKPGGISVTEAAQKTVPMVLINVVGGCETHNMNFFVNAGGAVTSDSVDALALQAVEICKDEKKCDKMQLALKSVFDENDIESIYTHMNSHSLSII